MDDLVRFPPRLLESRDCENENHSRCRTDTTSVKVPVSEPRRKVPPIILELYNKLTIFVCYFHFTQLHKHVASSILEAIVFKKGNLQQLVAMTPSIIT